MTPTTHQNALTIGSMLMEYRLESVLGAGGFGITYLARDTHLEKDVAIKEYFPATVAARTADHASRLTNPQHTRTTAGASTASSRRRARWPASAIRTSCG